MSTRRERIEARIAKRLQWAESRERKSAAGFAKARGIADGIPLGQPVLVGHHSEGRHRRDLARIDSGMREGCESADMAKEHVSKAGGLAHQLETSIFSDDEDAIPALRAKIAALQERQALGKAQNAAYRKGGAAGLAAAGFIPADSVAAYEARAAAMPSFHRMPCPSFELSNRSATIRQAKKRIEEIEKRQARAAAADAAGGVLVEGGARIVGGGWGPEWCRVTFTDKPERSVIEALKAAGFRWGGGSWMGPRGSLPACVEGGAT